MAGKKASGKKEGAARAGRKVVADAFVSMDGVMQAPGGPEEDREGGFSQGGWSMNYWDEAMGQIMGQQMAEPHELLMGRKTYDILADYWPKHPEEPGATSLNESTKYVATRSPKKLAWANAKVLPGDASAAVRDLKRQSGPPIHVLGSANLLQTLLRNDLVDELEVWVFPVALGKGKRLFDEGTRPTAWKLTRSQASTTGVLIQHYERAGDIPYGRPAGT